MNKENEKFTNFKFGIFSKIKRSENVSNEESNDISILSDDWSEEDLFK